MAISPGVHDDVRYRHCRRVEEWLSMANSGSASADGWSVGLRLWVERGGRAVLGKGRLELLEAIARWHSISAAARGLGMSYRHAWELIQSINAAAGEPLVSASTGGVGGGGAELTERGRWVIAVFRAVQDQLGKTASVLLPQLLQSPGMVGIHVVAAVSLEEAVGQLLTDYSLVVPGTRVRAIYGGSDELA